MPLGDCKFVSFRKIEDRRGNLTPLEGNSADVPFDIKRVYYLYDVPGGAERAGHAHKKLHQIIVAPSGSFDVLLKDGKAEWRCHINRPYSGLYIPPMIWRDMDNFSGGAVCLVLASDHYDENDYYRNYDDYLKALKNG